jgi:aldehyde dehydrogenase family 7 protein A1
MAGRVLPSERPEHVIYESRSSHSEYDQELISSPKSTGRSWYPDSVQFPSKTPKSLKNPADDQVAVFGWNFCIALAAGNSTIWKPSPTTPLYVYSLVSSMERLMADAQLLLPS